MNNNNNNNNYYNNKNIYCDKFDTAEFSCLQVDTSMELTDKSPRTAA